MSAGVSKKLCATVIGLYMVAELAKDNPVAGMIIIGVMCAVHGVVQVILDWRSNGKENE